MTSNIPVLDYRNGFISLSNNSDLALREFCWFVLDSRKPPQNISPTKDILSRIYLAWNNGLCDLTKNLIAHLSEQKDIWLNYSVEDDALIFEFRKEFLFSIKELLAKEVYTLKYLTDKSLRLTIILLPPIRLKMREFFIKNDLRLPLHLEKKIAPMDLSWLTITLYNHQLEAITYLQQYKKVILADDPGLGKTYVALVLAKLVNKSIVIICPAITKSLWRVALQKLALSAEVYSYHKFTVKDDCVLIVDEAHYIKNLHSKLTKKLHSIIQSLSNVIALTGTPAPNSIKEQQNLLDIMGMREYIKKGYALNTLGFLRRKIKDVFNLPEKREHIFAIDCTHQNTLDLPTSMKAKELVRISKLRTNLAEEKAKGVVANLELFARPCIIYGVHNKFFGFLQKHLPDAKFLLSNTLDKDIIIEEFQKGNIDYLVSSLGPNIVAATASLGITLTTAKTIIHGELVWNAPHHEQANARTYRIGLDHSIDVYYFVGRNTIDSFLFNLQSEKSKKLENYV